MQPVRTPAVAGTFYPDDPDELAATVAALLAGARPTGQRPKALIVPHAGYAYSGAIAAAAFAAIAPYAKEIRRVVMLGPPNGGSEVVDRLGWLPPFRWINGQAGVQLGTSVAGLPSRLKTPAFELGVIAGDRSVNPLLSLMIPGADDGKVSVRRARVEGMRDFVRLHVTHTFMMRNRQVIRQTAHFLKTGRFGAGRIPITVTCPTKQRRVRRIRKKQAGRADTRPSPSARQACAGGASVRSPAIACPSLVGNFSVRRSMFSVRRSSYPIVCSRPAGGWLVYNLNIEH